ncbi:MAG TPA: hypothetical protein VG938_02560 [Verrucomicrobiae bacterium]|jgi:hypothetical protein|nr:hypothetical protein [Verrucomicrobiae bacterium]
MRRLAQPKVMTRAAVAAASGALLCLPRMILWGKRPFALWYLEATLFLGGFVLWAFVFAWHTEYTHRPVFTLKIKSPIFTAATCAGVACMLILHFFLDAPMRSVNPGEYPTDFAGWLAAALFGLAFADLFLIFAPYAWLMRLVRNERVAAGLTVAFGVGVWLLKFHSSPHTIPGTLFCELFAMRLAQGILGVWFYLRGGVLLVWWLGLVIEARHLPGLFG